MGYQYFLNFKNNILLRNQNFNLNQFYDILSLSNCFLNQFFYYRHLYKFIDDKFIQMSIIKEKFDFINLMYYNKKICKLTCQINFKNSKIYKFSRIQQKFYDNYLNFKQNKVSKKNLFLKSFILFNSKTKSLTNFKQKMKEIRKLRLRILKINSTINILKSFLHQINHKINHKFKSQFLFRMKSRSLTQIKYKYKKEYKKNRAMKSFIKFHKLSNYFINKSKALRKGNIKKFVKKLSQIKHFKKYPIPNIRASNFLDFI